MNDLSERHQCVALDLPGFGDSDKPGDAWYSIARYTQLVAQFAGQAGIQSPVVVGHSMGGMIALALAAEEILPVRRLIAINPVVTGQTYFDLRLLANPRWSKPMVRLGRWFWPIASGDWAGPWLGVERAAHVRRQYEEWGQSTAISLMAAARAIGQCDLTAALPRITTPSLIVLGNRDMTAPNAEGRLAARLIPNARLTVLPSGHLPTDDLPDQTAAVVGSFLSEEKAPA